MRKYEVNWLALGLWIGLWAGASWLVFNNMPVPPLSIAAPSTGELSRELREIHEQLDRIEAVVVGKTACTAER